MRAAENARACPATTPDRPHIAQASDDKSTIQAVADFAPQRRPERELAAWGAAVTHLHGRGLPAPVPGFAAAWLRRRGIRPDWETAA